MLKTISGNVWSNMEWNRIKWAKKGGALFCLLLLHELFLFQVVNYWYLVLQICGKILKTSSGNMWSNIEYCQNKEWNGQEKEERSFCFHWTFPFALWSRYKTWTIFSPSRVTFRCNSNVRFLRLALNLQHIKSRQCLVLQTQLLKTTTINFLNSLWLPCRYWCVRNRLVCIWIFETPMATFPRQALPGERKPPKKCPSASVKKISQR